MQSDPQLLYGNRDVKKPATISGDALQVTPDSISANFILTNNSGRILLKQLFKLWDGDIASSKDNLVASFNTSFLINVERIQNETPGEGLAFLIAADLDLPPNSDGEFLGLTNVTTDGNVSNQVVAVELDTFKQDFDPDDNNIGIDINTVRSSKTESLTPHNITIAPKDPKCYNVWVDYDGVKKFLAVYIAEQVEKTGPTPFLSLIFSKIITFISSPEVK
ncbi:putative L-type lectin-domain containing receptor kinase S.5 [Forsythia ovata]|uniref:L-type lectin-domain containing receptor kinase S.5 n=1 Tax=Forsythia ovata TaxID=205694 RepID=A0ABD1WZV8_9LAMI